MLSINIHVGGTTDEIAGIDLKQLKAEMYQMSWINEGDMLMINMSVQDPPPPLDLSEIMRDYVDENGNPLPEPRKSN